MGLGRGVDVFNQKTMDLIRPTVHGAMDAVVSIADPELKNIEYDFTSADMQVTTGTVAVSSAMARIMPVRGANLRGGDPIQRIRIQVPMDDVLSPVLSGYVVSVEDAPMNPALVGQTFHVVEIMNSSNPITLTIEAMVNTHQRG